MATPTTSVWKQWHGLLDTLQASIWDWLDAASVSAWIHVLHRNRAHAKALPSMFRHVTTLRIQPTWLFHDTWSFVDRSLLPALAYAAPHVRAITVDGRDIDGAWTLVERDQAVWAQCKRVETVEFLGVCTQYCDHLAVLQSLCRALAATTPTSIPTPTTAMDGQAPRLRVLRLVPAPSERVDLWWAPPDAVTKAIQSLVPHLTTLDDRLSRHVSLLDGQVTFPRMQHLRLHKWTTASHLCEIGVACPNLVTLRLDGSLWTNGMVGDDWWNGASVDALLVHHHSLELLHLRTHYDNSDKDENVEVEWRKVPGTGSGGRGRDCDPTDRWTLSQTPSTGTFLHDITDTMQNQCLDAFWGAPKLMERIQSASLFVSAPVTMVRQLKRVQATATANAPHLTHLNVFFGSRALPTSPTWFPPVTRAIAKHMPQVQHATAQYLDGREQVRKVDLFESLGYIEDYFGRDASF